MFLRSIKKNVQQPIMSKHLLVANSRGFNLLSSPMHLLHRLNQRVTEIFDAQMKGGLLTSRQFAVLLVVSREEGLSQTALVQKTGIDRSTLADIVKRMIKKELLSRQRTKEDARAYSVKITENGLLALKLAEPVAKFVDDSISSALPVGQRDRFVSDLIAILVGVDNIQKESFSK